MLDARIYKLAFIPAALAAVFVAFSFVTRPGPLTTRTTADAFDNGRAYGADLGAAEPSSLVELAKSFPDVSVGSPQDDLLAARVGNALRSNRFLVRQLRRSVRSARGEVTSETVIAIRPGLSRQRIVILARRDGEGRSALSTLSATAALLELARDFNLREQHKTIVLVSTSGQTGSGRADPALLRELTGGETVELVLVLGDLVSRQSKTSPVTVWSNSSNQVPLRLVATVNDAVQVETGIPSLAPSLAAQLVRRALPFGVSDQAPLVASGLPAIMLQASGERGPKSSTGVAREHLGQFGRAVLRVVSALDPPEPRANSAPGRVLERRTMPENEQGVVVANKVLPPGPIKLLGTALLLPALLATLDYCLRARRRGITFSRWLPWVLGFAAPAFLGFMWLRTLDHAGLIHGAMIPIDGVKRGIGPWLAIFATALVVIGVALIVRRLFLPGLRVRGNPAAGGAAAATMVVLAVTCACACARNGYAAMLLLAPLHCWLFATAPDSPLRGKAAWCAVAVGLMPLVFVIGWYSVTLGLEPIRLLVVLELAVVDGHVSLLGSLISSSLVGCFVAVCIIVRARARNEERPDAPIVTRGPVSYAGPGSLGGTHSALQR